jgi:hypothetical protein
VVTERVREGLKRNDIVEVAKAMRDMWNTFDQLAAVGGYPRFAPLRDQVGKTLARLQSICARALLRRMLLGKISPAQSEECLRMLTGKITVEDVDAEIASLEEAVA